MAELARGISGSNGEKGLFKSLLESLLGLVSYAAQVCLACLHRLQHAYGRSLFQVLLTFSPVSVALPFRIPRYFLAACCAIPTKMVH